MSSHASLGAAADERRARLAKLKSLKRKQPEPDDSNFESEPTAISTSTEQQQRPSAATTTRRSESPPEKDVARLHLSGRNYDPETRGPKLGFENAPTESMDQTLEEQAAEVEAEVRQQAKEDEANDKGIDLFKLQPKKPNWDLKRELDKKMELLNVRTDNAIARLVRARLAAKKGAEDGDGGAGPTSGDLPDEIDGAALVEGLRLREQDEEEERRKEREADLV